jgi:hypothetical protein
MDNQNISGADSEKNLSMKNLQPNNSSLLIDNDTKPISMPKLLMAEELALANSKLNVKPDQTNE